MALICSDLFVISEKKIQSLFLKTEQHWINVSVRAYCINPTLVISILYAGKIERNIAIPQRIQQKNPLTNKQINKKRINNNNNKQNQRESFTQYETKRQKRTKKKTLLIWKRTCLYWIPEKYVRLIQRRRRKHILRFHSFVCHFCNSFRLSLCG